MAEQKTPAGIRSPVDYGSGFLGKYGSGADTSSVRNALDFGDVSDAVDVSDSFSRGEMRELNGGGGLSNTAAGAIGSGISTAASLAGGILGGVATKNAREAAEARSMEDIAKARFQRQQQQEMQDRQDQLDKQQARQANNKANISLRLDMFQRDLQKEMQKFADQQNALKGFRRKVAKTEALRGANKQLQGGI